MMGPNHLAVVNLKNEMVLLQNSIVDELQRIAQTYKSDYEIAKAREDFNSGVASPSRSRSRGRVVRRKSISRNSNRPRRPTTRSSRIFSRNTPRLCRSNRFRFRMPA